jgi:hypothetical protein
MTPITHCGIAYLGVLRAIDAWLNMKGIEFSSEKRQKSIEFYEYKIARIDKKMLTLLKTVYGALHLSGYYYGVTKISTIKDGFDDAFEIIEKIKPENPVNVPETRGGRVKMALNKLMISPAVTLLHKP